MNSLIHADVFFFVTTIVVALIGIVGVIASIYIVGILRNVKTISDRIKKEGLEIVDEISEWRSHISKSGFGLGTLFMFIQKFLGKKTRSSYKETKAEPTSRKKKMPEDDGDEA